jgi:hypothetical protein
MFIRDPDVLVKSVGLENPFLEGPNGYVLFPTGAQDPVYHPQPAPEELNPFRVNTQHLDAPSHFSTLTSLLIRSYPASTTT